ncbi:MAG: hypothetical protein M3N23_06290 [Pseudomonadota bacterium]|nr:hypothetical protein [Pseudomonadota bacterium]
MPQVSISDPTANDFVEPAGGKVDNSGALAFVHGRSSLMTLHGDRRDGLRTTDTIASGIGSEQVPEAMMYRNFLTSHSL